MRALLLFLLLFSAAVHAADRYGPYRGTVERVVDGDTIRMVVDAWPDQTQHVAVRLAGINAPELHASDPCEKAAGIAAATYLQGRLPAGTVLTITEVTQDKYAGRILAKAYLGSEDIAQTLINTGHARPYDGGARLPWCP